MADNYIPGSCNIGGVELKKRRMLSWITFIFSLFLSSFFVYRGHSDLLLIGIIFIFWTATIVIFLQVANRFCVRFGLEGRYNFGGKRFSGKVDNPQFLKADRLKALFMLLQAVFISAVISVTIYFLVGLK